MDDQVPPVDGGPEPEGPDAGEPAPPVLPELPPEVSAGDEELRAMIAEGASTPEELRALAARIREHRDKEASLWKAEVKPGLRQAKKSRFRIRDLVDEREADGPNLLVFGLVLIGIVFVLLLAATQGTVLFVILPVVGVLVYAYRVGQQDDAPLETPPAAPPGAEDAPD